MIENIPHRPDALEMDRVPGVLFEIFAEPDDEIVHGAGAGVAVVSPDALQDFAPGQGPSAIGDEKFQQANLQFGQMHLVAAGPDRAQGFETNLVFPEPVGPVSNIIPCGFFIASYVSFKAFSSKPNFFKSNSMLSLSRTLIPTFSPKTVGTVAILKSIFLPISCA